MRTIAVLNQKGGVGKTTTVANLGAGLAGRGCRLCLIDLDPQSHLTLHFGIEPGTPAASIYDVLTGGAELPDARVPVAENLRLVPSVIDLAAAEVELAATVGREQILRDALTAHPLDHQIVLIDCPPSLGLLTLNALAAADEVLIPLQPHFLALQGLGKLLQTIQLVQRRINPRLRVTGVILCLYETGTRLAAEVVADLRAFLDAARGSDCPWTRTRIFQSLIRRNVKLAECPSHGKTIFDYDAASRGAHDYQALTDEFLASCPDLAQLVPAEAAGAPEDRAPAESPPPAEPSPSEPAPAVAPNEEPPPPKPAPVPAPTPAEPEAPAAPAAPAVAPAESPPPTEPSPSEPAPAPAPTPAEPEAPAAPAAPPVAPAESPPPAEPAPSEAAPAEPPRADLGAAQYVATAAPDVAAPPSPPEPAPQAPPADKVGPDEEPPCHPVRPDEPDRPAQERDHPAPPAPHGPDGPTQP